MKEMHMKKTGDRIRTQVLPSVISTASEKPEFKSHHRTFF